MYRVDNTNLTVDNEVRINNETDNNGSRELIEWESTINVPIEADEYDTVSAGSIADVIFLFDNGIRLSNNRIEKKTIDRQYIFGYLDGYKFPIIRSQATECLAPIPKHATITRTTNRKIVWHDNVRVAYNCTENDSIRRYSVSYEIEYPVDTEVEEIRRLEDILMQLARTKGHIPKANLNTLESVAPCISSKVEMWHVFQNTPNYKWAYKWNGVRAKLLLCEDSNLVYLSKTASKIETSRIYGTNIDILRDMCVSVEIMEDRIVIIEVLGSKFKDKAYRTEVSTNLRILVDLDKKLGDDIRIKDTPLRVQKFYDAPKPVEFNRELYDGFIIIENDTIIKWKVPTVDVKCIGPYKYIVGDNTILQLREHGIKGKVYEISPTYEILRMRCDRLNESNENEYQVYLKSVELLKQHHRRNLE